MVVKESQSCSSSEDDDSSDCSVSSRGSGSLAEEEREVNLIHENVLKVLQSLASWALRNSSNSRNLSGTVIDLFNDQDDAMVEALLCLLDISVNCSAIGHHQAISETSVAIGEMTDPVQVGPLTNSFIHSSPCLVLRHRSVVFRESVRKNARDCFEKKGFAGNRHFQGTANFNRGI